MTRPRLGFLGVGWIGRHRMEAMLGSDAITVAAISDALPDNSAQAGALAPGAVQLDDVDALLEQALDGIVIATPSALHAEQSIRALNLGIAVFCQKPLGRYRLGVDARPQPERSRGVIGAGRSQWDERAVARGAPVPRSHVGGIDDPVWADHCRRLVVARRNSVPHGGLVRHHVGGCRVVLPGGPPLRSADLRHRPLSRVAIRSKSCECGVGRPRSAL